MPGVYISYPFCAQKCTYCNFASGVFPRELEPKYVDALIAEIGAHVWSWQPETVYLGGGTPSAMATADLDRILAALPGPWSEATIEAARARLRQNALRHGLAPASTAPAWACNRSCSENWRAPGASTPPTLWNAKWPCSATLASGTSILI